MGRLFGRWMRWSWILLENALIRRWSWYGEVREGMEVRYGCEVDKVRAMMGTADEVPRCGV